MSVRVNTGKFEPLENDDGDAPPPGSGGGGDVGRP